MEISELEVGNVAYVLSGRQNSFFNVTVMERDETGVRVYVHAKREEQWYYNNGTADAEPDDGYGPPRAVLVTPDDWRIKILATRKKFKILHEAVLAAANTFRKDPSIKNGDDLQTTVNNWRIHAETADQNALRAESIPEYLTLVNS